MEPVNAGVAAPTPGGPPAATPVAATPAAAPAAAATPPPLLAGTMIDVTVLRALTASRFLLALGSTEFVASSEAELKPGTQVRLHVAQASLDGVLLRLAEPVRAEVSAAPQRQAALNLPPGPAAAAVLAAFEEAGAPLEPLRLQAAVRAAAAPAAPAKTAQAHALLARAGLPATPALIGVALRATENRLPNVAAELGGARPAAAPAGDARRAGTGPVEKVEPRAGLPLTLPDAEDGAPAIRRIFALAGVHPAPEPPEETAAPVARPMPSARSTVTGDTATRPELRDPVPAPGSRPAAAAIADPASAPRSVPRVEPPPSATRAVPPTIAGNAAGTVAPAATSPGPAPPPLTTVVGSPAPSHLDAPRSTALATGVPGVKPPPVVGGSHPISGSVPSDMRAAPAQVGQPPPAGVQRPPAGVQRPSAGVQQPPASEQRPSAGEQRPPAGEQRPPASGPRPAPNDQQPAATAQRPAASSQQPAPASTPVPATPSRADQIAPTLPVRISLIREVVRLASEPARTSEPTRSTAVVTPAPGAMREAPRPDLAQAAPAPTAARPVPAAAPLPPPATESTAPAPAPLPTAMEETVTRTVREHLAEQVFKPKELADYDRVVPLPLSAAQVTTPARLAVATRSAGGGAQATFVRVDAELTRLGAVSIRLSGADSGGPLAITLITSRRSGAALAEELPALVSDLRSLGLDAAVRVVADD